MSLTVTARGTGGNNTASTSVAFTPSASITAGKTGVLIASADNAGSGGATTVWPATFTDASGNVWTRRLNPIYDPGAASAGVDLAFYTALITTALSAATTISFAAAVSTTAKAWTLWEVSATSGHMAYVTGVAGTGSATGAPTITTSSIPSGDVVFGGGGSEGANTWAGDADTTSGSWTTAQSAGFGTTTSGMSVTSQAKVVTATATQTYNPTLTSGDTILGWIQIHEIPAPTDTYGVEVWADSPAFWARLGEVSGSALDYMGGSAGTVSGTVTRDVTGATGASDDGAILLDGSTGYISFPAQSQMDLGDVFTLECWIKRTSNTTGEELIFQKGSNAYALSIGSVTATRIALDKDGAAVIAESTVGVTADGSWHHVAATKSGTSVHIYVDGTDVTGSVTNVTIVNSALALEIGREAGGTNFFNGSVDEVAIYPTVLSSTRVTAHKNAGAGSGTTQQGAASVTGTALVTAAAGVILPGAASVVGAATVSAAAVETLAGAASVAGAATVSASAGVIRPGAASVSGTATVVANGGVILPGASSVSGTATASAAGSIVTIGAASVLGAATVSAAAIMTLAGAATVSGTASVAASGAMTRGVAASVVGSATASAAAGVVLATAAASVTGAGTATATGTLLVGGAASVAGAATVAVGASFLLSGAASVLGAATISASAGVTRPGASSVTGTAITTAAGTVLLASAAASVTGVATVSATGATGFFGAGTAIGTATVTAAGQVYRGGAATVAGSATVAASAGVILTGAASVVGAATISAAGGLVLSGASSVIGTGSATSAGAVLRSGAASVIGAATAAGTGRLTIGAAASVTGTASVLAGAGLVLRAAGSANGAAFVFATGTSTPLIVWSHRHRGRMTRSEPVAAIRERVGVRVVGSRRSRMR